MTVYLGDHVETTSFRYRGRVYKVHEYGCPESRAWLMGQTGLGDDPLQYKDARWVSLLVHDGGAAVVPDLPEFINRVNPFEFINRSAEIYFRNP